jgi:hypothetical protein
MSKAKQAIRKALDGDSVHIGGSSATALLMYGPFHGMVVQVHYDGKHTQYFFDPAVDPEMRACKQLVQTILNS